MIDLAERLEKRIEKHVAETARTAFNGGYRACITAIRDYAATRGRSVVDPLVIAHLCEWLDDLLGRIGDCSLCGHKDRPLYETDPNLCETCAHGNPAKLDAAAERLAADLEPAVRIGQGPYERTWPKS